MVLNIDNIIGGDNLGIQSSKSDFNKPTIKNTTEIPNNKPDKKASLKKFFSNPWFIGISFIIIEELTLGRIWEFIKGI